MSYAGRRAIVSMKHVGLNVAADPFMNSALTGVNGGLVLAVADDPGMHSSQNEQDSRFYGEFAQIPVLEPANQQEAYDLTREAFELSEQFSLPVMVRIVTRLSHSRANVRVASEDTLKLGRTGRLPPPDPNNWVLVPSNARRRFRRLLSMQPVLRSWSEKSPHNELEACRATRHPRVGNCLQLCPRGVGRARRFLAAAHLNLPAAGGANSRAW